MTTDLFMLTMTAVLNLLIPVVYGYAQSTAPGGLEYGTGNRDEPFPLPAYGERAKRAHTNLTENLAPFAVLVLVAHLTGLANSTTALGATIFFLARVAHALTYIFGIKVVRTIVFFIGIAGEIMILSQLL